MSEAQPISGKRIWLGFHVVRSGVDTGGPIAIVPAFLELQKSGGFMNRGWVPIFPACDGNAPH